MEQQTTRTEEFKVNGDQIVGRVKEILHEGNIRRIAIRNDEGKTIVDIPLTWGVVGALVAPQLAALGAVAALLTDATIVVEKTVQ